MSWRCSGRAAFAWSKFLDDENLREFAGELADTVRAAADLDNLALVATVVTSWKHTAEVHADAELVRILTQPGDDHGVLGAPSPTA